MYILQWLYTIINTYIFIHIVNEETKRKKVPVWSSFMGCLRNLQINQAALSFVSVSNVFPLVNVNECPTE